MNKYLVLFAILLLQGCAGYSGKKQAFHQHFNSGNYEAASTAMYDAKKDAPTAIAETAPEEKKSEGKVLPSDFSDLGSLKFFIGLNSGTAALYSQKYQLSDAMFGVAETSIEAEETDGYSPKYYEKVMLNTYRAIALFQNGDVDNAKVEFNRANASQKAALDENKSEIDDLREDEYKENIAAANNVISSEYKEFEGFKPYADFANPYTSYMSGLFLSFNGNKSDIENAVLDFKKANSMSPENKFVKSDIEMARNIANNKKIPSTVWVVYEDGLISEVDTQHFAIPFKIGAGIKLAHMALPKIVPLSTAYPNLQIANNNKNIASTQSIVDMDRVMKTEFKNRFPMEVTKAVAWMTVNLIAQEAAQQALGEDQQALGAVAALAMGAVSNPVETRTWSSLPKDIQIARFSMPKDRKLQLLDNTGKPIAEEIVIDKEIKQALVYVRVPTQNARAAVSVTKLK